MHEHQSHMQAAQIIIYLLTMVHIHMQAGRICYLVATVLTHGQPSYQLCPFMLDSSAHMVISTARYLGAFGQINRGHTYRIRGQQLNSLIKPDTARKDSLGQRYPIHLITCTEDKALESRRI